MKNKFNRWYIYVSLILTMFGYFVVLTAERVGFLYRRDYFQGFRIAGYRFAGISVYLAPIIFGFAPLIIYWMAKHLPCSTLSGGQGKFKSPSTLVGALIFAPCILLSYIAVDKLSMDAGPTFFILFSVLTFYFPIERDPERIAFAVHVFTSLLFVTVFAGNAGPLFALLFLCVMYIILWLRFLGTLIVGIVRFLMEDAPKGLNG